MSGRPGPAPFSPPGRAEPPPLADDPSGGTLLVLVIAIAVALAVFVPPVRPWLRLHAVFFFCQALAAATSIAWLGARRVRIREVGVGAFSFARLRLGRAVVRVGLLPLVTSVQTERDRFRAPEGRVMMDLSPAERAFAGLAPPLALFVLAAALVGPTTAAEHLERGLSQVLQGTLHPVAVGTPLVTAALDLAKTAPWPSFVGVLTTRLLAAELLSGLWIAQLVDALWPSPEPPRGARLTLYRAAALPFRVMVAVWTFAVTSAFYG